ncbi:uncharacterized protein LOC18448081 isoform X3 [Amborella trichopoda]|uniref:uncharacterized protein LOC18448081 isoform X3 n=1 Tax=Amborella trichopoda TaxID=13333 RepID=UPI0009C12AC5|nr:uncharacterized protein LOC18448081 isoform X3 [Amborella trichopoda]|eukprot:XP_020531605.1 uncharacterized protein LOC18448081 isoform X3 [Amborella trichopoda]
MVHSLSTHSLSTLFLSPSPAPSHHFCFIRRASSSTSLHFNGTFCSQDPISEKKTQSKRAMKALKEWQEYEEAVRERDLGRALKFLESLEPLPSDVQITTGGGLVRDWEVLDACLNADDMKMVGSAYEFLQLRGFLPNFGKYKNRVSVGSRNVTPTILKSSTGLDASKLSPKKWGLSGSSGAVLVTFLGGVSFLLSKGIDIRPNLAAVLGLAWLDSIFLGGCCIAQISFLWPPYRRRVLVHEAGHLLIGWITCRDKVSSTTSSVSVDARGRRGPSDGLGDRASSSASSIFDGLSYPWCHFRSIGGSPNGYPGTGRHSILG